MRSSSLFTPQVAISGHDWARQSLGSMLVEPTTWAFTHCFPRCTSKWLDWNWSSWHCSSYGMLVSWISPLITVFNHWAKCPPLMNFLKTLYMHTFQHFFFHQHGRICCFVFQKYIQETRQRACVCWFTPWCLQRLSQELSSGLLSG